MMKEITQEEMRQYCHDELLLEKSFKFVPERFLYFAYFEEGKPKILGFCSNRNAGVYVHMHVQSKIADLRQLLKDVRFWLSNLSCSLFAEIDADNPKHRRFAEFLGFSYRVKYDGYIVMEYKNVDARNGT